MKIKSLFLNLMTSVLRIFYVLSLLFFLGSFFVLNHFYYFIDVDHDVYEGFFSFPSIMNLLSSTLILIALILEKKNKKWLLIGLIPFIFIFVLSLFSK